MTFNNITLRLAPLAAAVLALANHGAQAQATGEPLKVVYSSWTKFCLKGSDAKEFCYTRLDGKTEAGHEAVAAMVIEPTGQATKTLRIVLPLGMQLAPGTRIAVDNKPLRQAPFVICFSIGCISDYDFTSQLLSELRTGRNLAIEATNTPGERVVRQVPLDGFNKSFDGPPVKR